MLCNYTGFSIKEMPSIFRILACKSFNTKRSKTYYASFTNEETEQQKGSLTQGWAWPKTLQTHVLKCPAHGHLRSTAELKTKPIFLAFEKCNGTTWPCTFPKKVSYWLLREATVYSHLLLNAHISTTSLINYFPFLFFVPCIYFRS